MRELFVDNFAGGGGATTGIEIAIGRSVDIAINHDKDAIAMHKTNHPKTKHFCEDIWNVDPVEACGGKPVALAWFSPSCTHFSRAKGGKPLDKNIRGLAWVEVKWGLMVRPRVMMMENVSEIQSWCPLGDDARPIKNRTGETFNGFVSILTTGLPKNHPAFLECIEALDIQPDSKDADILSNGLGYNVEYRELSSCDYGAATSRRRFYMIARCDGNPIVWPDATYGENGSVGVKSGELKPYKTIAECIDWKNRGESIFNRDKPLCEKTMKRIAMGLKKFVLDDPNPFMVDKKYVPYIVQYHGDTGDMRTRGQSMTDPIMTIDTSNRYALVIPEIHELNKCSEDKAKNTNHESVYSFLLKYYGSIEASSMKKPLDTLTSKDRFAVVTVCANRYAITDIFLRMLTPREMFKASGFPDDYIIDRYANGHMCARHKQVARVGNAVTPPVATELVKANLPEYCGNKKCAA